MLMIMKSKFTTLVQTAGQLYVNTCPPSKLLDQLLLIFLKKDTQKIVGNNDVWEKKNHPQEAVL